MSKVKVNAVIQLNWSYSGTRFKPFAQAFPPPLFPIAGKAMVWHHLKALGRFENRYEVGVVYLQGTYSECDFLPFIDQVGTQFDFEVKYIQESGMKECEELASVFKYKEKLLEGGAKMVFVMSCDICSSFPLQDMIQFQEQNQGLLTVMTTYVPSTECCSYDRFEIEQSTNMLTHYHPKGDKNKDLPVNCGVYLLQSSLFDKVDKLTKVKQKDANQKHHQKVQQLATFFNDFAEEVFEQSSKPEVTLKDVLLLLCQQKQAYCYRLQQSDFWMKIKHTEQIMKAQDILLQRYLEQDPLILTKPASVQDSQLVGFNMIHPSAEIAADARIGPNCAIGASVKVGEGARIANSIVLEDAVIQPSAVVLDAIIGWTSVVGSWARVEGVVNAEQQGHKEGEQAALAYLSNQQSNFYKTNSESCHDLLRILNDGIATIGAGVFIEPELHLRNCVVLPNVNVTESSFHQIIT